MSRGNTAEFPAGHAAGAGTMSVGTVALRAMPCAPLASSREFSLSRLREPMTTKSAPLSFACLSGSGSGRLSGKHETARGTSLRA